MLPFRANFAPSFSPSGNTLTIWKYVAARFDANAPKAHEEEEWYPVSLKEICYNNRILPSCESFGKVYKSFFPLCSIYERGNNHIYNHPLPIYILIVCVVLKEAFNIRRSES